MPAKGRRVAARQAQLGRRKRRQSRPDEDAAAVPTGPVPLTDSEEVSSDEAGQSETVATQTRTVTPTVAPAPVRGRNQPSGRVTAEIPLAYSHLGKELRRIFIMAGILTTVLIVLTIFI